MIIIIYVFLAAVCGFFVVVGLCIRDELREHSSQRAAAAAPVAQEKAPAPLPEPPRE